MEYTYWDVHFKRTKTNTLNFINALFWVRGRMTDCDTYGYDKQPNWKKYIHHQYILARIAIPAGREKEFEDYSKIYLREPPKVSLA
jgi:hypothetical protein